MMLFLSILSSLYAFRHIIHKQDTSGFDERYIFYHHEIKTENITIKQIIKIQEKKGMLDFLKSSQTSVDDKLNLVDSKNMQSRINIFNGGLLDDWTFQYFM